MSERRTTTEEDDKSSKHQTKRNGTQKWRVRDSKSDIKICWRRNYTQKGHRIYLSLSPIPHSLLSPSSPLCSFLFHLFFFFWLNLILILSTLIWWWWHCVDRKKRLDNCTHNSRTIVNGQSLSFFFFFLYHKSIWLRRGKMKLH
jgi:hypothetical protein